MIVCGSGGMRDPPRMILGGSRVHDDCSGGTGEDGGGSAMQSSDLFIYVKVIHGLSTGYPQAKLK